MKLTLMMCIFIILFTHCQSSKEVQSFLDPKTLAKITIEITIVGEDEEKQKEVYKRYGYNLNDGPKMYRDSITKLNKEPKKELSSIMSSIDGWRKQFSIRI
ncbi:MAG: hypothetical protein IEMM0008_1699 [bacterium]|nr:MAG: hypothetical protein IEMM0008_1699 [bacterium]